MAEKKKSTTKKTSTAGSRKTSSGTSAKKRTGSGRVTKAQQEEMARAHQLKTSVLLFVVGALLTALAFVKGDHLWLALHGFYFGIFGSFAYLLGILVLYWAILAALRLTVWDNALRALALCLALCGTLVVFTNVDVENVAFFDCIKLLYKNGQQGFPGGGIMGFLGAVLLAFAGKIAAKIIVIILLLACLMLFTGVSMGDLYNLAMAISEKIGTGMEERRLRREEEEAEYERMLEEGEEEYELPEPEPRRKPFAGLFAGKRPSVNVDVDLGPDPAPAAGEKKQVELPGPGVDSMENKPVIGPGGTFGYEAIIALGKKNSPAEPAAPAPEAVPPYSAPIPAAADLPSPFESEAVSQIDIVPQEPAPIMEADPAAAAAFACATDVMETSFNTEEQEIGGSELADLIEKAISGGNQTSGEAFGLEGDGTEEQSSEEGEFTMEQPMEEKKAVYMAPPIDLFDQSPYANDEQAAAELKEKADKLVTTLEEFGVRTKVLDISRGPSVTRYELQPLAGVKISKITGLADDIALNLAVGGVRIEAPIPGKPAVGVEVPNRVKDMVSVRDMLESKSYTESTSPLTFCLGKDIGGETKVADLNKMPHMLIAGSTGSGKSVCVNAIIMSFISRSGPEDVRMILIDPKVVELASYNGIPHLLMPVVTDPKKAAAALCSAVGEMERRYKVFSEQNVKDIKSYNRVARNNPELEHMPYIAIIIDELADLMMVAGKQVEESICRIAQKARAAGMHLIIATQRPSVDVITGLIKANVPSRIAFAVSSQIDSRTILDTAGAEKLLGQGDMLFQPIGVSKPIRIQGAFAKDEEIERALDYIKAHNNPDYDEAMSADVEKRAAAMAEGGNGGSGGASSEGEEGGDGMDSMLKSCVECVLEYGQASTSLLQRRCKLGYSRAARMMDEMEQMGIIGPYEGAKPRRVLIDKTQWIEMQTRRDEPGAPEEL